MNWKIPLYKIYHDENDKKAVDTVVTRDINWTNGPEISDLEKHLADYVGTKYAVSFNNGTSALHAMLLAYGIGPGDEVIVPSFTFISTSNSVLFTGAKPVFADIENESYSLDPEDVRKKITKRTKAILPIHYGGCAAKKINEIKEIADEKEIKLFEDAAESLGSRLNGKNVGTFGDSAMFSFCANKIITGGEGGAITTNSEEIYEKMKLIRSHGRLETENYFYSNKKMDYISLGYNFRMPSLIAALVLSQLKKIEKIIKLRRNVANKYRTELSDLDLRLPLDGNEIYNVYQLYTIRVDQKRRDTLKTDLEKNGIMSRVYFDPIHETHFYKNVLGYKDNLANTEQLSKKVLSIPLFATMEDEELQYVCEIIKKSLK